MGYSMIRTCGKCGRDNRVPAKYLAKVGRCGVWGEELAALGEPLDVGEAEFDEIVGTVTVPVLVDFWAEWCGPCRMAAPEVKTLAKEMAGNLVVLKVDTDWESRLAGRYGVQSIPNFKVFHQGRVVFDRSGVAPAREMKRWVESAVK